MPKFHRIGKLLWTSATVRESGLYYGDTHYRKLGFGFFWESEYQ